MATTNVNSIRYKIEPFKEVLNESIFDVLTIQETKIDESFPDNQFYVPMYRLYKHDFKHNEGGIMTDVYTKRFSPISQIIHRTIFY